MSTTPQRNTSTIPSKTVRTQKQTQSLSSLSVVQAIENSRFPVYIVKNTHDQTHYAMKLYPSEQDGVPSDFFLNELRFTQIDHPNLLKYHSFEVNKNFPIFGDKPSSYILMEYAPYGDFFDALRSMAFNEKLIRTYFHQLINTIDFLHQKSVFHLDLKLENMMLGSNFELKLIDFELSAKGPHEKIIHRGSKNYRAPEILNERCQDAAAADVYSIAIIMFVLRTRGYFPHYENELYKGYNFFNLLENNAEEFWNGHIVT